ncbi:hypothetical protein N5T96_11685 [Aliarcobacter butzleri]|uniref:hypothetical protein n=1 Tax=Aliarcobacter butzleri TaxID=28197 RepID=UPI0021B67D6C|nr:hypothetical protein [Aliarcobacter butzleri]MCT7566982.1 hypothetical protein [Aliarcobacter butzleri]
MAGINFDELDNIEFNTFNDQDKKANFLNKRKKVIKGTSEEKTERIGLKFTPKYKQELEEYKKSLGVRTFNALLYKLIELGKETHIQELQKLIKKD